MCPDPPEPDLNEFPNAPPITPEQKFSNTVDAVTTVSSYLLLTQAGAQTHWHVDMTGSSVFYQVIVGRKEFWLLRPTYNNLEKLHEYHTSARAQTYEYT